MKLGVYCN